MTKKEMANVIIRALYNCPNETDAEIEAVGVHRRHRDSIARRKKSFIEGAYRTACRVLEGGGMQSIAKATGASAK